jgi:GNAT superfamily N-acetyltransferase
MVLAGAESNVRGHRVRHHASTAHRHLAILAVYPDHQVHGVGSLLLAAHHAALDHDGIAAAVARRDAARDRHQASKAPLGTYCRNAL